MREDAGVNIAASRSMTKQLFSVKRRKPSCLYKLWGCPSIFEACTSEELAPWTRFLRWSAVSLTDQLLANRRTQCSVGCPSLLRWSSLHDNLGVIHHLAPLSLSSSAVISPGSWWCWMVTAPPLLVGSAGVQRRSSWTSAVASPRSPSLGLDLWVSCVAPLCVHGASRCKFTSIDGCAAVPSVLTDRCSIYSLFWLFSYMFVQLC